MSFFSINKGKKGCLSLNRSNSFFFSVSDCSELYGLVCVKMKPKLCGPNAILDSNGNCSCVSGSFEPSPGDASSAVGCKDPCLHKHCETPSGYCHPLSASDFECRCTDEKISIRGTAFKFGCSELSMRNIYHKVIN